MLADFPGHSPDSCVADCQDRIDFVHTTVGGAVGSLGESLERAAAIGDSLRLLGSPVTASKAVRRQRDHESDHRSGVAQWISGALRPELSAQANKAAA
jgi:hypothetical protein